MAPRVPSSTKVLLVSVKTIVAKNTIQCAAPMLRHIGTLSLVFYYCMNDGGVSSLFVFSNECKLKYESCHRAMPIEVDYRGACDPCRMVKCEFYSSCQLNGLLSTECRCNEACDDVRMPSILASILTYSSCLRLLYRRVAVTGRRTKVFVIYNWNLVDNKS